MDNVMNTNTNSRISWSPKITW